MSAGGELQADTLGQWPALAEHFQKPRRGHLRRVEGEDAARAVPLVEDVRIIAKQDQLLEPLPEAGSYLGFIFARGTSASAAIEAVRAAHARLSFAIEAQIAVRPA